MWNLSSFDQTPFFHLAVPSLNEGDRLDKKKILCRVWMFVRDAVRGTREAACPPL